MESIKANKLTIQFGNVAPVQGVDFYCLDGEFVALVGKSGTGKSSILNAVARFIPFQGEITTNGQLGYIFQQHALFPWMTCRQNIGFGLEGLDKQEKENRVTELLERIDIPLHGDKYPAQLSGGQVQRVAIARTLAVQPKILLADEPFAALDFFTRDKMHEWFLQTLDSLNLTVLFVSHFIEEAIYLADRILVLKDAKIVGNLRGPFQRPREPDMKFTEEFARFKRDVLTIM